MGLEEEILRIVGVALRLDGVVFSMPAPNRHYHLINKLHELGVTKNVNRDHPYEWTVPEDYFPTLAYL